MAFFDELLKIEGVAAADRFTLDGKLTDFKKNMDIPDELAQKSAQYCATISMMFKTLSDAFTKESHQNWAPMHGWTYTGGDWTVVVWGDVAIWCETRKTDMHKLFQVLESSKAEARSGI